MAIRVKGFFSVVSDLHLEKCKKLLEDAENKIKSLKEFIVKKPVSNTKSAIKVVKELQLTGVECLVVLISSGGTTHIVYPALENIDTPLIFWATPEQNALASGMNIYHSLKKIGKNVKLIFGDVSDKTLREIKNGC